MRTREWVRYIRKGDVLRSNGSGTLRVVRYVRHTEKHTFVGLVIQHCSWTGRCYTIVNQHDLATRFQPTGKRVRPHNATDKTIEMELNYRRAMPPILTCCDVRGLA